MPEVVRVAPLTDLEQNRRSRKPSARQLVKEEYRGYINQIEPGSFLELKLSEDERQKYPTIKDRLLSAARDLDKTVIIRRRGDVVRVQLKS